MVQKDPKLASLGFASLYKCGKHLILPGGGQGLLGFIAQGLIKKMSIHVIIHKGTYYVGSVNLCSLIEPFFVQMVEWFEKCRQLWIQCGLQWDENLIDLSEDFLNALMVS